MELNYLREFILLSETMNYLETAEELFISQSTLTRHIQAIESELGVPLFIRTPRRVELSEFGRKFLPYAQEIVRTQDRYTAELLVDRRRNKKVIVGFGGAMSPYNMAAVFAGFKAAHPGIELEVIRPKEELEMLRTNQCDFVLTSRREFPQGEFNTFPFLHDRLVAVVPIDHRLAGRGKIDIAELAQEQLLLMRQNALDSSGFMTACHAAGFRPEFTLTDGNNMIDFAALGQYIPIMTKKPALFFADRSVAVLDIEPKISFRGLFAYRRHPRLSPAEKCFMDYLQTVDLEEDMTERAAENKN